MRGLGVERNRKDATGAITYIDKLMLAIEREIEAIALLQMIDRAIEMNV